MKPWEEEYCGPGSEAYKTAGTFVTDYVKIVGSGLKLFFCSGYIPYMTNYEYCCVNCGTESINKRPASKFAKYVFMWRFQTYPKKIFGFVFLVMRS